MALWHVASQFSSGRGLRWFSESEIPWSGLCFDHGEILRDYFAWKKTGKRRLL